jgi:hypothetical protein
MRKMKMAMLAVVISGGMLFGGCGSLSSLPGNIWKGFGYGLGAIPANIVGTWIATVLGIQTAA